MARRTGTRYGCWRALRQVGSDEHYNQLWLVVCECGRPAVMLITSLREVERKWDAVRCDGSGTHPRTPEAERLFGNRPSKPARRGA